MLALNKIWMRFGFILGIIISPIILGIIFFTIFTPIGILLKLLRRDELHIKKNSNKSYWRIRENNISSSELLNKQY